MKITDILFERKIQRTQLMYHGTSSVFLSSIMKYGLLANPPKVTYSRNNPVSGEGFDSFGGVYLARNPSKARDGATMAVVAHGGHGILLTLQYVLSSGTIDEDDITHILFLSLSRAIYSYMHDFGDKIFDYNTAIGPIMAEIMPDFESAISRKEIKIYKNTVDAIKNLISVTFSLFLDKIEDKKLDRQDFSIFVKRVLLNKIRHEPEFDSAMRKVLQTTKPLNSETVRLTRNVGFKGKTRIIKIEQAYEHDRAGNKVYYPRQAE
jgi:hypothetical protein